MEGRKGSKGFYTSLLLIGLGLYISVYLAVLYVRVQAGESPVDSICAISEQFNCVKVANCNYSDLFGIPVAVYGIEFYLLLSAVLLFSHLFAWPMKSWESFQFFLAAVAIPVSLTLGYISFFLIESICPFCLVVYFVNSLLFIIAGFIGRWRLKHLLTSWFFETRAVVQVSNLATFVVVGTAMLGSAQFYIFPQFFAVQSLQHESVNNVALTDGLRLGSKDAVVQIEEFTDFECPFCSRAHHALMAAYSKYSDKVSIRHFDYPLDLACNVFLSKPFHLNACRASQYARCAAAQNKFWIFENYLFGYKKGLDADSLNSYAKKSGIDMEVLKECLEDPETIKAIKADIALGSERGISGTPTFFVNGNEVRGMRSVEFWEEKIGSLIRPIPED